MKKDTKLNITESSDFQYLLELLPPLYNEPAFAWLPEMFSIVGCESLILLCKYAGGEVIKVPTVEQLSDAINALEWYYKVWISREANVLDIPARYHKLVTDIARCYHEEDLTC